MLLSFMSESRRLSNARMKRELRVRLRYPTPQTLLDEIAPRDLEEAARVAAVSDASAPGSAPAMRAAAIAARGSTRTSGSSASTSRSASLLLLWPTLSALWLAAHGAPHGRRSC